MKKIFLSLGLVLLANLAMAQKVSLDFTTNGWNLPTSKTVDAGTYTNGTYSIKVTGSTGNGYNFNTSCLMLGKQGATLELPAFDFNVSKIEVYGTTAASAAVMQNIFVGSNAVSTETTGAKFTDATKECNTYMIAGTYQTAGNVYVLKVTSAHNTQITAIKIYEAVAGAPALPSFSVAAGTYTTAQTVAITCDTTDATIYYTLDGTTPTSESTLYTEAINITAPTTVNAVAIKNGVSSEVATATYNVVVTEGAGTQENPYTIADVKKLNNPGTLGAGVWVAGTIVGVYSNNKPTTSVSEADSTNIALATATDTIPVALTVGAIRKALNLVNHSNYKGYEIKVKGDLVTYFTVAGVKNTSDYELGAAPEPVDFDTVNITVSTYAEFSDFIDDYDYWQVVGYDETEEYYVSLSPTTATQVLGTYSNADLDAEYNYVYVVAEDTTLVTDSATAVVTAGASEGDYNFDAMIYVGTTAYHITITFVAPVATTKYTVAMNDAQFDDYISNYNFVLASGATTLESSDSIYAYVTTYMDEAATGSFTEADIEPYYSYFEIAGNYYDIYTATYTITYNADGSIVLAGTFLLYGNIQVNLTMTQPVTTAISNTEADVKTVKFIRNNQVVIEKNNVRYTVLGQEIR